MKDLVTEHLPLVHSIVRGFTWTLPRGVDREDLVGWGCVGLCKASRAFDPERGVSFATYAYPRIKGEILDNLSHWYDREVRPVQPGTIPYTDDVDHRLAIEEVLEAVHDLPESERGVVVLHYIHGLTQKEVAAHLGLSRESVCCVVLPRALRRLRRALR